MYQFRARDNLGMSITGTRGRIEKLAHGTTGIVAVGLCRLAGLCGWIIGKAVQACSYWGTEACAG